MKFSLLFVAGIVFFYSLSSCKKGDDGKDGSTGTANVKYSEWFTATPWKKDTIFSVYGFNYIQNAPDVTQNILDSGVVLIFGKLLGYNQLVWPAGQIGQLPIDLTYQQGTIMTDTWSGSTSLGKVKIRFVNDKNYYSSIAANHQFRYVIIPGGIPAGRGVNFSYQDICRMYNIPE